MKEIEPNNTVEQILLASGIKINGDNPWDIRITNNEFYRRVFNQRSLGLGESYMDGWWNCEKLDEFFYHLLRSQSENKLRKNWRLLLRILFAKIFNMQSSRRAYQIGEKHYDSGNELFKNMLDERMVYSCAYWKDVKTLSQAQENKLDLVCRKLWLQPGMRIFDIGCGWGGFAKYAAEKYRSPIFQGNLPKPGLPWLRPEVSRRFPVMTGGHCFHQNGSV